MAGYGVGGQPDMPDFVNLNDINAENMTTGTSSPTDKTARSSFSSVRENDDGLAQTFTRSKVSSYTNAPEEVFDESPSLEPSSQPFFQAPVTQPNSRLHGFWFPAESFRGWREIPLKGKKASRSAENLRKLCLDWSPPETPVPEKKPTSVYRTGRSPLETLPSEVLGKHNSLSRPC